MNRARTFEESGDDAAAWFARWRMLSPEGARREAVAHRDDGDRSAMREAALEMRRRMKWRDLRAFFDREAQCHPTAPRIVDAVTASGTRVSYVLAAGQALRPLGSPESAPRPARLPSLRSTMPRTVDAEFYPSSRGMACRIVHP